MYNPTDRLEQALGTVGSRLQRPPSSTSPEFKVSQPTDRTGRAEMNLSWENLGLCPSHLAGTQRVGGGTGRDGTATVCSWDWNTPLFQGERSVTTLGAGWGKARGSAKELPGCRHLAEHSLWLPGLLDMPATAGPFGPASSGGRGCGLGLFGRKKKKQKRNST